MNSGDDISENYELAEVISLDPTILIHAHISGNNYSLHHVEHQQLINIQVTRKFSNSQLSELTCSLESNNPNQSNDLHNVITSFGNTSLHSTELQSALDPEFYDRVHQQIRNFHARNSAYERALRLTEVLRTEEMDQHCDNSIKPTLLYIAAASTTFICFIPMMILPRHELANRFKDTLTEESCLSTEFLIAVGFTLGSCAPLMIEISMHTAANACRFIRFNPVTEFAFHSHLMGQSRTAYCLSVVKPTLILFSLYVSGSDDLIAPYFMCQLYWQPVMYMAISLHFISKYTPNVVSTPYLLLMFASFVIPSAIGAFLSLGYTIPSHNLLQGVFWILSAVMYCYYITREIARIVRSNARTAVTISIVSIHVVLITMVALEWVATLMTAEIAIWSPLNLTIVEVVFHLLIKTLIIILFYLLPANLASKRIDRTKGVLRDLLAITSGEEEKMPDEVLLTEDYTESSMEDVTRRN